MPNYASKLKIKGKTYYIKDEEARQNLGDKSFVAEYGETTFVELAKAMYEGKNIYCHFIQMEDSKPFEGKIPLSHFDQYGLIFTFSSVIEGIERNVFFVKDEGWSYTYKNSPYATESYVDSHGGGSSETSSELSSVKELSGDDTYKTLAEFFTIQEDGNYNISYFLHEGYTVHGTSDTNNVLTVEVNYEGNNIYTDIVATKGIDARLDIVNSSKNIFLNKGSVVRCKGRISGTISISVSKSGSAASLGGIANENQKTFVLSENMENGGLDTKDNYWYFVNSNNRSRIKKSSTLHLDQSYKIRCSRWDKYRVYVAGKTIGSSTTDIKSGWLTADYHIPQDGYYVLQIARQDESSELVLSDEELVEMRESLQLIHVSDETIGEKVVNAESNIAKNARRLSSSASYVGNMGLSAKAATVKEIGSMSSGTEDSQGMTISGKSLVNVVNGGYAHVHKIDEFFNVDNSSILIPLGCKEKEPHCNSASFGLFYSPDDALPLLYVSGYGSGTNNKCYVERIAPQVGLSDTIQTITIESGLYGNGPDFTVDTDNNRLIAFGNTISSKADGNKHRVMVFNIPNTSVESVSLSASDAIENYLIEDLDDFIPTVVDGHYQWMLQDCCYNDGKLYILVSGVEYQEGFHDKAIYVWDLANKSFVARMSLNGIIGGEIEGIDFHNGSLVVSAGFECQKFYRIFDNNIPTATSQLTNDSGFVRVQVATEPPPSDTPMDVLTLVVRNTTATTEA